MIHATINEIEHDTIAYRDGLRFRWSTGEASGLCKTFIDATAELLHHCGGERVKEAEPPLVVTGQGDASRGYTPEVRK